MSNNIIALIKKGRTIKNAILIKHNLNNERIEIFTSNEKLYNKLVNAKNKQVETYKILAKYLNGVNTVKKAIKYAVNEYNSEENKYSYTFSCKFSNFKLFLILLLDNLGIYKPLSSIPIKDYCTIELSKNRDIVASRGKNICYFSPYLFECGQIPTITRKVTAIIDTLIKLKLDKNADEQFIKAINKISNKISLKTFYNLHIQALNNSFPRLSTNDNKSIYTSICLEVLDALYIELNTKLKSLYKSKRYFTTIIRRMQ